MPGKLQPFAALLALALASPALAPGMFDPRPLRPQRQAQPAQEPGAPAPSRGGVEVFSATPGTPTITNRLRPGEPAVPVSPEQAQQRLRPESTERIEFQDFILQSTGRDLPVFGSNLFRRVPSTFAPVDNIPVTS